MREEIEEYLKITFGRFYPAKEKRNFFPEADEIVKIVDKYEDAIAAQVYAKYHD